MEILWVVIQKSKDLSIDYNMIITTTVMFVFQVIIVTWIVVTNPEPCPKEYIKSGGDVTKYCEMTSAGLGYTWSLKE